jgi:phosphoserine phosphatase
VLQILKSSQAVCFDVDSTVCTDEGIDELAAFLGAGEAVAEWTRKAMGGGVPFQEALKARLDLMNPSREQVAAFLAANPPKLSPGIKEVMAALKANGKDVYLVSGGFRQVCAHVWATERQKAHLPLAVCAEGRQTTAFISRQA